MQSQRENSADDTGDCSKLNSLVQQLCNSGEKPTIGPLPKLGGVLDRVKSFLPQIARANQEMTDEISTAADPQQFRQQFFDIEYCGDSDSGSEEEASEDQTSDQDTADDDGSASSSSGDEKSDREHDKDEILMQGQSDSSKTNGGNVYIEMKLGLGVFDVIEGDFDNHKCNNKNNDDGDDDLLEAIRKHSGGEI